MRLQVKGKNLELSDSIRSYAEQKLSKLDKQLGDMVQVEVELDGRAQPVHSREPGGRGDGVHEGTLAARPRGVEGHAFLDRRAHGQAHARGEGVPRQAPSRAAPQGRAQRSVIFRRKPLHERLAREAGLLDSPGEDRRAPWDKAGIHGVHRPREWDDVADPRRRARRRTGGVRRARRRRDRRGRARRRIETLADALSLDPPYRAEAVRRDGRRVGSRRTPDRGDPTPRASDGAELELSRHGDERTVVIDG